MDTGLELLFNIRVTSVLTAILIPLFFYWYSRRNHDYWKKRGIPFAKPYPFYLSYVEPFLRTFNEIEIENFKKCGKIYGYFEGNTPHIYVGDPELVRNIFVKDFQYFVNRRLPIRYELLGYLDNIGDPVADNMLSVLRDEEWKRMRMIVSPTFTTGKIKKVMSILIDCTKTLIENFRKESAENSSVNATRLYAAFTMDVISSSAFSTKIDSHNDPENVFVQNAKNSVSQDINLRFILCCLAPKLMKLLGLQPFRSETGFFKQTILEIIKERRKIGETRNDFLQLLIDSAKEVEMDGKLEDSTHDFAHNYKYDTNNQPVLKGHFSKHLSMDEIVAQCFIFIVAGYHTTSVTLSNVTYLLTIHQEEQEKVYQEIKDVLSESNGEVTYDAVQKMKHLDCVISETLRLFSPAIRIERQATANYKLGDTGITIPKGMLVCIPVHAMHRNSEFFPNPGEFRPSRFSAEERDKIIPYSFLPFGAGPRNCVGLRFALMEMKVCLIYLLSKFRLEKSPETKVPLEIVKGLGILNTKPVYIHLEERKDDPFAL